MAFGARAGAMRQRRSVAVSFERQYDRAVIVDTRTYTAKQRERDIIIPGIIGYSAQHERDRAVPAIRFRSLERQNDVAVATATTTTFPNGYRYRRIVTAAPFAPAGVLLIVETLSDLKSVSNGGLVQSTSGWDIRCEDGSGNKIAHVIDSYSPTTGRLVLWVRQPIAYLYYGKAGLSATEANAAGMAVDFSAWWSGLTGTDYTGQTGRSLTPTAVTATTLGELVAGLYNGTTALETAAAWAGFTGLTSLTLDVYCQAAATGQNRGLFIQGPKTGGTNLPSMALYWRSSNASGEANPILWNIKGATTAGFFVSGTTLLDDATSAPMQDLLPMLIHATGVSGSAPGLFVRGAAVTASSSQAFSGSVGAQTGAMWLGDGPDVPPTYPTAGPWSGRIAFARLRAGVPSAAQAAAEWLNINDPKSCYGIGDRETFGDVNHSPVAIPTTPFAVTGNSSALLDVLATAVDQDGDTPSLAAGSVTTPSHGTAAISAGKVLYTPTPGYAGADSFLFGAQDPSGKVSIGKARVSVSAAAVIADLPTPLHHVPVTNYATLVAAMAAANAGDQIDCADSVDDTTYQGAAIVWNRPGNATHPIVVKANNKLAVKLRCGTITLSGTYLWIYGLDLGPTAVNIGGQHPGRGTANGGGNTVKRCKFYDYAGSNAMVTMGVNSGPVSDHGELCYCDITHRPFVSGDYNNIGNGPARFGCNILEPNTASKPQRHTYARVHHNNFHDFSPKPTTVYRSGFNHMIRIGDASNTSSQMFAVIEYNIFQRHQAGYSIIETKTADNIFRYNTIRDCTRLGAEFAIRNGRRARIYGNTLINVVGGILVLDGELSTVNTVGHIVSGNDVSDLTAGANSNGINVQIGSVQSGTVSTIDSPAARNCLLVGNIGKIDIGGGNPPAPSAFPVTNTIIMKHMGTDATSDDAAKISLIATPLDVAYLGSTVPQRGTVVIGAPSTTVPGSPIVLTAADIRTYTPVLLTDADVGPNAP